MKTDLQPKGRGAKVSPVVEGEVALLKAFGAASRKASALPASERAGALRQVSLAFAADGKARRRMEAIFRAHGHSF